MQPNMTFPLCIYFMHLVERTHESTQDIPCLLEWEAPEYILFRCIYGLSRDISCLILMGLHGFKL